MQTRIFFVDKSTILYYFSYNIFIDRLFDEVSLLQLAVYTVIIFLILCAIMAEMLTIFVCYKDKT